jgi:hypothetical protein
MEQITCYVAPLSQYKVVLGDRWLRTHNPVVDWVDQTVTFNSPQCFAEGYLRQSQTCTIYAQGSKARITTNPDPLGLDIQLISACSFLNMASRPDHHGFMIMPRDGVKHLCATTTNTVQPEDYNHFMAGKAKYILSELKKRVLEKYHSVIEVFLK